jgi:hypothetical protein
MDDYISQIIIASDFLNSLEIIHNDNELDQRIIYIEGGRCSKIAIPIDHNIISMKILNMVSEFFKRKRNVFEISWTIFPLIRIYLKDENEVPKITGNSLNDPDIEILYSEYKTLCEVSCSHLISSEQGFNPYYSYKNFTKFSIKQSISDDYEDIIKTYFHNIRCLFALICLQIYINSQHIFQNWAKDYMIDGEEDMYNYYLSKENMQTLTEYMTNFDISLMKESLQRMNIKIMENKVIMSNDIELFDWINYIHDSIDKLLSFRKIPRINDDIEKISMLIFSAYKSPSKENNCFIKEDEMTLITECVRIVCSEFTMDKKVKDWTICTLWRLFTTNFTNLKIANEIQTRILNTISERKKNFKSYTLYSKYQNIGKYHKSDEFRKEMNNTIDQDREKCIKILQFLTQMVSSINITSFVIQVYDEVSKFKSGLDSLKQIISN